MIKNMKTYFKLLRNIDYFFVFIICGLGTFSSGIFYFIIGFDNLSVATLQMAFGLNYITLIGSSTIFNPLIGSSPLRRFIEITAPNIINVVSALFIYIIVCLTTPGVLKDMDMRVNDIIERHISGVLGIMVAFIFIACMYKHMIFAAIIFVPSLCIVMLCKSIYTLDIFKAATLTGLYIKGFIILVIGLAITIGLRHWFEKHPYMSIFEKQTARRT